MTLPLGLSAFHRPWLATWFAAGVLAVAESGYGATGQYLVYVGTYTGAKSKGIYVFRFDAAAGTVQAPVLAAELRHPTFLDLHPSGQYLYAVNEVSDFAGQRAGAVTAFAVDRATGQLSQLSQVSSRGAGPCHIAVHPTGTCLFVANYGGGSVAALPIGSDGRLGEATSFHQHEGKSVNPRRQEAPHAHGVTLAPDGRYLFVPDLGLDRILVYRVDAARATLTPHELSYAAVKPGAGPRHFAMHSSGRFAYAINELDSTITGFNYDLARGALSQLGTVSTLPSDFAGPSTTAEIEVHPSGKYVYGSNRGHDSLAVFAVRANNGALQFVERVSTGGKTPRSFGIEPGGTWLWAANQGSDNLVLFRIEAASGRLTPSGPVLDVGAPVCVKFLAVE
ncbi:MAG: lactonase family protein [Verrucomicrobia bacterium]|nr:lactonase family protein [Verrucomicrobiota bacterium]